MAVRQFGPEKKMKGFPDIKHLKQIIRDRVAPDKELGHIDK